MKRILNNIIWWIKNLFKKERSRVVIAPVLFAGVENSNGRTYSINTLEDIIEQTKEKIENKCFVGEMGHSDWPGTSISRASHLVKRLWIKDFTLWAEIEILKTNNGDILLSLVDSFDVVFRPKGAGTVDGNGVVKDDYVIFSINAILKQEDSFLEYLEKSKSK
jgi:hypothetical protein